MHVMWLSQHRQAQQVKISSMSPIAMPVPQGTDVLSLNLTPCYHISLPYILWVFDNNVNHQRIQTTRLHASRCHHCNYCHYCNIDCIDCYSIMSHAILLLFYHAFMLTLQNSLISVSTLERGKQFHTPTPMSRGHRSRGGTNRHFIHVGPLGSKFLSFFSSGRISRSSSSRNSF